MIFILVLISLITRLSFLSKYLYNWDSAQFALAFDVFNISMHQPHPPGYFLYVAFAKLIDFVLHNANLSYIFENILFFILSSIIFYRLALLVFKNKNKAMVTSLFFIFNPVIWFYGEIAAVYMVDLFFSLLFVYFSWLILIEKDSVRQNFILFSFLLGISGGFRQTLIILFAPLWLLVCFFFFKNSRSIKSFVNVFLEVIIILLIGLLLWLLPTVYLSQGFKNYLDLIQAQFSSAGKFSSLFQEANYNQILTQIKRVTKSLILILNFLLIFLPFGFWFFIKNKEWKKGNFLKKLIIFAFWFLPSLFVYYFMHFAQVGYLFTISAGIILLLSGWFYEMLKLLKFKILQILFLIIFIFVESLTFINGWQTFRPKNNRKQQIIFDKIIDYSISPHQLDWPGIRKNDEKIQKIIRFIKEFKPEETLIITEFGSRYLNNYENWPDNFRILSYYLPEYEIYEIFLGDDKIYFKTQQRIYSKKETADIIILPATVKNLIFVNPMTKINGPQDVLIASHQNFSGGIHILKVDNVKRLEYLGYNFIFKEDKSIFNRKIFLKWDYLKEGFEKI